MFWCNIFQTRYEVVVAICDEDLIEKVLDRKERKIKVSRDFYGGQLVDEKMVVKLMRNATIGNLIGKEAVEVAGRNGFISKDNIILIDDVPHAQFVKLK
jgi:hypothetical protein